MTTDDIWAMASVKVVVVEVESKGLRIRRQEFQSMEYRACGEDSIQVSSLGWSTG